MYDIAIDPARQLMTIKFSGFWTDEAFRAYAIDVAKSSETLRQSSGFRFLLLDLSDFPIQANGIAERHGRLLRAAQDNYGLRAAVVMQSALSRLQAMRVAKLTGNDLFVDQEVALATLISKGE